MLKCHIDENENCEFDMSGDVISLANDALNVVQGIYFALKEHDTEDAEIFRLLLTKHVREPKSPVWTGAEVEE